jgi:hypothetical protein
MPHYALLCSIRLVRMEMGNTGALSSISAQIPL